MQNKQQQDIRMENQTQIKQSLISENPLIIQKQQIEQQKASEEKSQAQHKQINLQQDPKNILRKQLKEMDFDQQHIQIAINQTNNLEQAVQSIVNILEQQEKNNTSDKNKQVLVMIIRMDLKMSTGKIAAQCAHATLKAFQNGRTKCQHDDNFALSYIQWLQTGKEMTYYKVEDQQSLYNVIEKAKNTGFSVCHIRDAGRTQVAAGSSTVGAIGPCKLGDVYALVQGLSAF